MLFWANLFLISPFWDIAFSTGDVIQSIPALKQTAVTSDPSIPPTHGGCPLCLRYGEIRD